jgi:hypothetical protein
MGQRVDIDDLVDANGVAELLGLTHRNTVSVYQHRYPEMPRPVLDFRQWTREGLAQARCRALGGAAGGQRSFASPPSCTRMT